MSKKMLWAMRIYVILCFTILLVCLMLLGIDLGNYVNGGEFIIFQEFNMAKYKVTDIPFENLEAASHAHQELIFQGEYRRESLPHLLLSFSLWVGQLNIIPFYIHKWCKIKMRKWLKYLIWIEFVFTIVLIVVIRLAMDNAWAGALEAGVLYPAAYWLIKR